MNKFLLASIVAILLFIIIIVVGGYTERYSTYYGQGVSFQYPMGWNVTQDPGTSLVFSISSSNNIGVESTRTVVYERNSSEIQDVVMDTVQTDKYSTKNKVITEYYGKSTPETFQTDTTIFLVQSGGKIFSITGYTLDKKYLKRVADTLMTT